MNKLITLGYSVTEGVEKKKNSLNYWESPS
jgi:hypothetical protein